MILKTHFYHTPKLYHPQPLANERTQLLAMGILFKNIIQAEHHVFYLTYTTKYYSL